MVIWLAALVALIGLQRLLEIVLASSNRKWMLAQGAQEFGAKHYRYFFMLHFSWFCGWIAETLWRGIELNSIWGWWLGLFIAVQGLRYWCIVSLGRFWNTRILVIPGGRRVCRGPYRLLRHPNYMAVSVELACVPLIFGAWLTALAATIINTWLLLGVRIPAEEEALRQLQNNGGRGPRD